MTMRPVISASARGLRLRFGLDPCARRRVHATPWVSKSVKEKISEVADKVNKKVGEGLASAIETGEKATAKTKKTIGVTTQHAKDNAEGVKEAAYKKGQKAKHAGNNVVSGAEETGKKQKGL